MSDARLQPMLLVDCSQRECVLGLAVPEGARRTTVAARRFTPDAHAPREAFWDELRALMAETGLGYEPRELGSVAVAVGPGGFTGLRVSIAFAKAVAISRGISVVPVPSALVFAASDRARRGPCEGPWLVALAAKGGTAWVALVEDAQQSRATEGRVVEGRVVDAAGFDAIVAQAAASGGVLLADGHLDAAMAERARAARIATGELRVDVAAFAAISAEILARGGAVAAAALAPIYAREPEAVTNWRARAAARGD